MELVFTRYLYPKTDAKQSLLIALLEHNTSESLFWAYELYYSGFEEETLLYLMNIYDYYYKSENPDLNELITKKEYDDYSLGTIVQTLSCRNYQVFYFMKEFKSHNCLRKFHMPSKNKLIIKFKETDLEEYKTILPEKGKSRTYLNKVCKYNIRREYNTLFESTIDDLKTYFWYHWLYFACGSPIWLERISEYGGLINDDKMIVEFPDDDSLENFYEIWGFEPDEQKIELQNKIIGNYPIKQLSIDDFCEQYGGIIKLTNSITYM